MRLIRTDSPLLGAVFVLLFALSGCATLQSPDITQKPGDLATQAQVENVPFYPQERFYCGPASLAMMLAWAGHEISQESVAEQVYTPGREGTLTTDLLSGARRHGALAVEVGSLRDLLAEIEAGHPVLVFQNLGLTIWPQWHYAVAYAYDLDKGTITLHSGTQAEHVTAISTFERTWARADNWAITVTPPEELPAAASAEAVVAGAVGLERADQLTAAITAYRRISERWPENIAARMGLGNTLYSQQAFAESAQSFKAALSINPTYAPAWNNLAYSLWHSGESDAAIAAARQAVQLGGDDTDRYQQSLAEISRAIEQDAAVEKTAE